MIGKQWLTRYASTDMRGSAIERSQNRQRKLDGIVAWYFDHVMGSLPLMLQAALLLLGCALSRYLWVVNITVASVVLGVTSSGMIIYIFIIIAGAASESCPYQTPGSHALHFLGPKVQNAPRSAASVVVSGFRRIAKRSQTVDTISLNVEVYRPWRPGGQIKSFLKDMVLEFPRALVIDIYRLGRVMIRTLAALPAGAYRLGSTVAGLFASYVRRARNQPHGTPPTPEHELDQQMAVSDFRCISWMLQTSLDKAVRLLSMKHLATMTTLVNSNPTLVAGCFNVFISCIKVNGGKVVITQGLEPLATVSAMCFLRTFHRLSSTDPTSSVLGDVRRRHDTIFPFDADFGGFPFYHAMAKIHDFANQAWAPHEIQWDNYRPSTLEHVTAARDMAEAAQVEFQKGQEVPCFILHFVLHSLSLYP